MSNYTGSVGPEVLYSFSPSGGGTALSSFTTEASLMGGFPIQQIYGNYFTKLGNQSSTLKIKARLQISTTGTPTFAFTARLLSSATAWSAGGLLLGTSGNITAASGVTGAWADLDMDVVLQSIANGAATSQVGSFGTVSGSAFPNAGSIPANNVSANNATLDNTGATQYYLWLSAACGTSSASNKAALMALKIYSEN